MRFGNHKIEEGIYRNPTMRDEFVLKHADRKFYMDSKPFMPPRNLLMWPLPTAIEWGIKQSFFLAWDFVREMELCES